MWLGALAGVAVVAGVIVAIALAAGGGGDGGLREGLAAAGCTAQTFPAMGRQHVEQLKKGFKYNSDPPTSGPHHPTPAIWNVYDTTVEQFRLVHNLEHGGLIVQYGDEVPQATVQQIVGWYRADPNGIIVAPLPRLGDTIALTAWTHLASCPRFDEKAFDEFRDTYRGRGPERIPVEALQPGST
jgi:hypothetical protein